MRAVVVLAATTTGILAASAGSALAAGQKVCVVPGAPVVAAQGGTCTIGQLTELAVQSEVDALNTRVAALERTLSKVSYDAVGLNGKPTLKIAGANLQIVSGSGATDGTVNGLGNLFIGYNEHHDRDVQTGSHNLILGQSQSFTSYGGLLAGQDNGVTGPFSSVTGGIRNRASGSGSSVTGGPENTASGPYSSVTGGVDNYAGGPYSSVTGGAGNAASGSWSSVTGGGGNRASGSRSSVTGGGDNTASGWYSSILGGLQVTVSTEYGTSP